MLVPPKGDFSMLPLNAEARRIANTWDPAKEVAGGEQCNPYGAAAIMRVPGRLHIHWADDNTLQMDIDSGTQTRLFRFGAAAPLGGAAVAGPLGRDVGTDGPRRGEALGALKVTTTRMRPGYLRKNGVPYSENATLEEYFDRFTEPNGDEWLVVDSIVTDPRYLTQPYITSTAFKKIPDRSGWDPTPSARIGSLNERSCRGGFRLSASAKATADAPKRFARRRQPEASQVRRYNPASSTFARLRWTRRSVSRGGGSEEERHDMRTALRGAMIAIAAAAAVAALWTQVSPVASQSEAYRAPRTADGVPDLNGFWQTLNTAHYDIQAHPARPALALVPAPPRTGVTGAVSAMATDLPALPVLAFGALGGVPAGQGVVEVNEIPYQPSAAAKRGRMPSTGSCANRKSSASCRVCRAPPTCPIRFRLSRGRKDSDGL